MSRFGSSLIPLLLVTVAACSSQQPAPVEPSPADAPTAPPALTETPQPEEPAPADSAPAEPLPASEEAEAHEAASAVVDPGGLVEVQATKDGLSRIGSDKCKMCHKLQFASWSESAHSRRTPPLDCESCHGPGSEYKALAVMKDPAQARAAGLVTPDAAFCATCHTAGVTDELRLRVHAHKAPAT